jgi:hypothetical protein
MSTANLDSADLKAALSAPGLIREDVMNKIWDISKIPLPFTDMVGKGSHSNEYNEWTEEALAAPNVKNRVVDGSDAAGNDTELSVRVGNHSAIADKVVKVSYRAQASNSIGNIAKLGRQVSRRQQELRRDVEAQAMAQYASLEVNGTAQAGVVGGLPTWLKTSTVNVTAPVGFNTATKYTTLPVIAVDGYQLTEADIRDLVESIYTEGGDPTVLMTIPGIVRKISEYLFTSSARVAALMSDQGKSREAAAALGSVNVFVTDFGTLRLVANRLQQKYNIVTGGAVYSDTASENDRADVFILDPQYLKLSYLHGYRTDPLAKTGLADNRQMVVDWSLCVLNEKSQGFAAGVDPALDVIAG